MDFVISRRNVPTVRIGLLHSSIITAKITRLGPVALPKAEVSSVFTNKESRFDQ